MAKVLNLDSFETKVDKTIRLDGEDHKFVPFSVEDFINELKGIEAKGEEGVKVSEFFEFMVTSAHRAFPTISEERLRKLDIERLRAIHDFIKGEAENETQEGLVASGEATGESSS